ncbi:MAG: FAD-dependent oxidoreductase, partial [Clostridia bacterium]|nr:FAD-dependent oxidoreductase [Clostridia bacterium]
MRTLTYTADLCVVGGGLSGLCCAIAAARHGIKVVLVQDRPVLGGNASSEIRMWVCGANGENNREGGIIEELMLENYYQNPGLKFPIWDSVLYEKAMAEPNLTLLLNSSCLDATMDGERIVSIKAWQSNAETFHTVYATYFTDCSGDSILAPLSGAKYTYGREAKSDFGESIPPDAADKKTMGMSCLFQIRETDHPVKFTPPAWAYTYPTDADLPYKSHHKDSNFW